MVSTNGEVYSKNYNKTGNVKIMKQRRNRYGYMQIQITRDDGVQKLMSVHRLVAFAFLEKIEGKDYINHKNGRKDDNRVKNLEWCTASENTRHSFFVTKTQSIERLKEQALKNIQNKRNCPKLTEKQIKEIREIYKTTKTSYRKLAQEYGCGKTLIGSVIKGQIYFVNKFLKEKV